MWVRWFSSLVFVLVACSAESREWADSTGKYKIQAELVLVRGDTVILEKTDGSMITIPIARLSRGDQAFLNQSDASKPIDAGASTSKMNADAPEAKQLATEVEEMLGVACHSCHGEDGTSEGGFNFVTNLEKLSKTFAKPGSRSLLLERISAHDDSVMPPVGEEPRLTDKQIARVKQWIQAGSPAVKKRPDRPFITNESIVSSIKSHVGATKERSQRFMRYFTLTHLYNAGVSDDELQTYRNAFFKLINSLSWNTELVTPEAVDKTQTIYGLDMRDLQWTSEFWQAIEEANPYFLRLTTPDALACYEYTQTEMPYVRIDWFVFAASRPPLYHLALNLPDTDRGLESLLRVNVETNIDQERVIRAGFNRSGVSQNNRLIEWHKSPYGSYWKSYDFGSNTGRQNLFEYPLGPGNGAGSFQHDGGEIIFTLPNGLQGYLLVDERGDRINVGPTNIVSDPKRVDRAVTNGVSCMSCHYSGVIPKKDEIGIAVQRNRRAFEEHEEILALYRDQEELDELFDKDTKRFSSVLSSLGITNLSRSGESISAMSLRFQEDIDLNQVACEFGLEVDDFNERLAETSTVARVFSSLRVDGGTLKRDVFKELFSEACVDLRLTEDRGRRRPPSSAIAAKTSRMPARSTSGRGRQGKLGEKIAEWNENSWGIKSLAFSPDGSTLAIGRVRALSLFQVDSQGVINLEDDGQLEYIESLCFSPDGRYLVAGGSKGVIVVYEVARNGMVKKHSQFAGHVRTAKHIAISRDSRFVMTGSEDKTARYWELDTGQELGSMQGFRGAVNAVHIERDGKTGWATDGSTVMKFDLRRNQVERTFQAGRSYGRASAFSPDATSLAVANSYNVQRWNLRNGAQFPMLKGSESIWNIKFTADGSKILTGGNAKVSVWDAKSGQRISVLGGTNTGYVQSMAVSSDSSMVAFPTGSSRILEIYSIR